MDWKDFFDWLEHNKIKVGSIAAILVVLVILIIGAFGGSKRAEPSYGVRQEFEQKTDSEEVKDFIDSYYKAYAAGDIDTLTTLAEPISDMEKSYITFISEYINSYEIVDIYSKRGPDKYSILLSVEMNVHYKDVAGGASALDFFYVNIDANNNMKIDNRYCLFNQNYHEFDLDENITALYEEFLKQDDVKALKNKVKEDFENEIATNEQLQNFQQTTYTEAITQWATDYQAQIAAAEAEAAAAAQAEAEAAEAAQAEAEAAAAAQAEAEAAAAAQAEAEAQAQAEAEAAAQATANGFTAGQQVTVSDIINIREEMDANSTKAGVAMPGSVVNILENSDPAGWTKVEHNGRTGYIRTDLLH